MSRKNPAVCIFSIFWQDEVSKADLWVCTNLSLGEMLAPLLLTLLSNYPEFGSFFKCGEYSALHWIYKEYWRWSELFYSLFQSFPSCFSACLPLSFWFLFLAGFMPWTFSNGREVGVSGLSFLCFLFCWSLAPRSNNVQCLGLCMLLLNFSFPSHKRGIITLTIPSPQIWGLNDKITKPPNLIPSIQRCLMENHDIIIIMIMQPL